MEKVSDFVKKLMQDREFKGGNVSKALTELLIKFVMILKSRRF